MVSITAPAPLYMLARSDGRVVHIPVVENLLYTVNPVSVYVDQTLPGDITDGSYSITNRNNSGGDGNAYTTIQAAVTAAIVGTTIFMREGAYSITAEIIVSNTHRGTSWASGDFYALESYPGEWAVLTGNSNEMRMFTNISGGFDKRDLSNQTSYWRFSKFEVTGCASAFWFTGGPTWFRNLKIHGLRSLTALRGAIFIGLPHDCIIEYSYFYDNNQVEPLTNPQYAHTLFDADYRDDELPATFDPDVCTKKNIIRYNYFDGSNMGIGYKNQQRFGINTRNPADVITNYGDWGDNIHHNIILNCPSWCIKTSQDNMQVHHNITNGAISQQFGANAILYNSVLYNNTVIPAGTPNSGGYLAAHSGLTESGNTDETYYDVGALQVVHLHEFRYNNIISEAPDGYRSQPFLMARDMPANTSNPLLDRSDIIIENNLINNNQASASFMIGRNNDVAYPICENHLYTVTEFNSCSDGWRAQPAGTVINWEVDGVLFLDTVGSDQYVANSDFVIDGSITIANGGEVGASPRAHPYLNGVTLPAYVGATNPSDYAWVEGLYTDIRDTTYLRNQVGNPTWLEG